MLYLYKPKIEDLYFRENLLRDEETMSFNRAFGGRVEFPRKRWRAWYNKWLLNEDGLYFYRYIGESNTSNFIGELAYYYEKERNIYLISLIIHAKYRSKGYGSKALKELEKIARDNGLKGLYDDLYIDNPALSFFLKNGYEKVYRDQDSILVKKSL